MSIVIEISPGELIDRMTILQIKSARLPKDNGLTEVNRQLDDLRVARAQHGGCENPAVIEAERELHAVNLNLWDAEDALRRKEATQDFGPEFIALARSIYIANDRRSRLKQEINETLGSSIAEWKWYA
jgi:uncharacterized protein DUF6165